MRATPFVIATVAVVSGACRLSGTASAPEYVCAAQDAAGAQIECAAPIESYPGDGCRCAVPARGGRGPDVFFGRVVAR
jgi:hypothetical protein